MADPIIYLRPAVSGGGFSVTIEPTPEGADLDQDFPAYKSARGYAGGARMVRGWKLIDFAESEVARG